MCDSTGSAKTKTDQLKDVPNQLPYFVNKLIISKPYNAAKTHTRKVTPSETYNNYGSDLDVVDEFDERTVTMPA